MNKKTIKYAYVTLGLSLCGLAACSSSDNAMPQHQPFVLASSIQGISLSRTPQLDASGKGQFADGDVNTLFFTDADGHSLKSFDYTYGQTYYWDDVQLNAYGQTLKVSACYPAVSAPDPANFSWDVTARSSSETDFLAAAPVAVQEGVTTRIPLRFTHLMHKFIVQLQADGTTVAAGDLAKARIAVDGFFPEARVNLLTATVTGAAGTPSEMDAQGAEAHFILPPQAVGVMAVQIALGKRTQRFKLSELHAGGAPLAALESGKAFTLTVKVSKNSFTIAGQGIDPWGSQGEANGEIIL